MCGCERFGGGNAFGKVERHLDADDTGEKTDIFEHLRKKGGKMEREAMWRN